MGASGAPTEEIDQLAERTILARLDAEGVDWDFLGEEIGHVRRGGGPLLVVDPIDGTYNVLRGIPFAAVSLALGRGSLAGIEIGMVRDLYGGTTFWASRGEGAFRDGHRISVRTWDRRQDVVFASLGRHVAARAVERARRARRIRSLGCASLELAHVAEGAGDAYLFENEPEHLNLRATDIAAGYRILTEAGGGMANANGEPLDGFPLAIDRRTSVFAFGDRAILDGDGAGGQR